MKTLLPFLVLSTSCIKGKRKQFELTPNQALKEVSRDIEMGSELDSWLKKISSACNAKVSSCPSLILTDLEKRDYQDDAGPEYLLYDAFIERLTSPQYGITILERDQDALSLIELEKNGVKLPSSMNPVDTTNGDDVTPIDKMTMAGGFIEEISGILASQDVLLFDQNQCCNADGSIKSSVDPAAIIANDVGSNKARLIKDLADEYLNLFPKPTANELPQQTIDVKVADYMLAYRIYRFNNSLEASTVDTERTTTLQMHVRIIDMNTGEIIVSDFLSNELIESLNVFEQKEKERKAAAGYKPYLSYGAGLSIAQPQGVLDNAMSSPGLYGEYNYFTKEALRLTGRVGFNGSNDRINSLVVENSGEYYEQAAFQVGAQLTLDKVFRYNKPLQLFAGGGVDFGSGSLSYSYIEVEDNEAVIGEVDNESGFGINILFGGGLTYNIDNLGLKAGYVTSIYSLSDGAPAQAVPMIHLGFTYSICGQRPSYTTEPTPVWNRRGNACTRDSD